MAKKSNFVSTPADLTNVNTDPRQRTPGEHDGEKGVYGEYGRTTSPNGVPEKIRDGQVPKVKGD